jgi:cysteinyl-tRNA synthetase
VNVPADPVSVDWTAPEAQAFRAAMDDDFNTAGAVAVLFDLAGQANRESDRQASGLMRALAGILGLLGHDPVAYLQSPTRFLSESVQADAAALPSRAIDALVAERTQAKAARDFARADQIRDQLKQQGIELADVQGGATQWRRV